jgi:hemerythrin
MRINKQWSMFALALGVLVTITAIGLGLMVDVFNPVSWTLIVLLALSPLLHRRIVARRFVQWRDEYSVGIASIDDDHKRLLNLINQLQTAVHYQTGSRFEQEALDALVDYTRGHFRREEELMELHDYPDLEAHRAEHQRMIHRVEDMLERYRANPQSGLEQAVQYLKHWLIHHINGTDQAYSAYLRDRGVR